MNEFDAESLLARFDLKCRACGSADVVANFEEGDWYSDTSNTPACLTIGCNACKKNDLLIWADD